MNLAGAARHHLFVNGLGKAALRFERLRLERARLRRPLSGDLLDWSEVREVNVNDRKRRG